MLLLQVSEVKVKEVDEETITLMMVDELQSQIETFWIPEARDCRGGARASPRGCLWKRSLGSWGSICRGWDMRRRCRNIPRNWRRCWSATRGGIIDEESHSTPTTMKVNLSPGAGHAVPVLVASGSTSSLRHYSRARLVKITWNLVVPSPDQLSCCNHPFFEGLHLLFQAWRLFITMSFPSRKTFLSIVE